jgi:hypothetical protein
MKVVEQSVKIIFDKIVVVFRQKTEILLTLRQF